ncbi:unnamed protein product [Paramecium sonneborni]|uniref:Uncharacterized protein n=1 Tax=Paramecium sonneborni TaxID=65129 RepID=A0A8S1M0Q5_9CILI|nr:unnamed protein product [Paramecium sonneborni]
MEQEVYKYTLIGAIGLVQNVKQVQPVINAELVLQILQQHQHLQVHVLPVQLIIYIQSIQIVLKDVLLNADITEYQIQITCVNSMKTCYPQQHIQIQLHLLQLLHGYSFLIQSILILSMLKEYLKFLISNNLIKIWNLG